MYTLILSGFPFCRDNIKNFILLPDVDSSQFRYLHYFPIRRYRPYPFIVRNLITRNKLINVYLFVHIKYYKLRNTY